MNLIFANGKSVLKIENDLFIVEDAIECITLADSFVKNKIGSGHGESKLYVGQTGRPEEFFGDFDKIDCIVLKKDFRSYLIDAKQEYEIPQQEYLKKAEMPEIYLENLGLVESLRREVNHFHIYKVSVNPPRVYINSNSEFYGLIRKLGLPNISYLSILKLKNSINNKVVYYFRMFIDYRNDLGSYISPDEERQIQEIENSNASIRERKALTNARVGQGEYREKLLLECPFCPFTMVNDERLLIASHIKPWASSNDSEKVDPKNGFILTPTYDRLFDKGFITFKDDKTLVVSPWLSPMNQKRLDIYTGKKIPALPLDDPQRLVYLAYHREHIFKS